MFDKADACLHQQLKFWQIKGSEHHRLKSKTPEFHLLYLALVLKSYLQENLKFLNPYLFQLDTIFLSLRTVVLNHILKLHSPITELYPDID